MFSRDVTFNEAISGFEANDDVTYVQIDLIDDNEFEEVVDDSQTTGDDDRTEESTPKYRRSTRERKRPDYYGVYINLTEVKEPTTVHEALTGTDKEKWKSAMNAEYMSLMSNDVWELTEPPEDCNIVKCKWVFRLKVGPNGLIERYKARLVAQGYSQRQGQDYEETFSPVVRFESVHTIIALAVQNGQKIHQMDVETTFLNGELSEDSEYIDAELYQSAVGKLLYLSTRTRPDISFAVSSVARYTAKPTTDHWKAVKHIFRYLVGTVDFGLFYSKSSSVCLGYSDSDWGGDLDDRKSTSGYVFQIGGGPIIWQS